MNPYPYSRFENTLLWRVVEKALSDLRMNRDLTLTTDEKYVIGHIVKVLAAHVPGVVLTDDESVGVHNAINEVCNGIHIEDAEFQTRIGISRDELSKILERL